jgi:hypothetical protein
MNPQKCFRAGARGLRVLQKEGLLVEQRRRQCCPGNSHYTWDALLKEDSGKSKGVQSLLSEASDGLGLCLRREPVRA